MSEEKKATVCYSYEVKMVVQIFAENEESAKEKLDKDNGVFVLITPVLFEAVEYGNHHDPNAPPATALPNGA